MTNSTYKVPGSTRRTTHMNSVLLPYSWVSRRVRACNTAAKQEIVVIAVLEHERGLLAVVQAGIVGQLVRALGADLQWASQLDLEEVLPVGAKLQVLLAVNGDPIGIDAVVGAICRQANYAVVGP